MIPGLAVEILLQLLILEETSLPGIDLIAGQPQLFRRQRSLFSPHTSGLVIPINTISIDRLREELRKAIAEENYRLASSLHAEIKKRTNQ